MSIQDIEIKELDPEIIPPLTDKFKDPTYNGGSKIVVVGKPGCFAKGTKVMMCDGSIKNVEDIKVGDQVMGDDSTPRNILELCHNKEMMYTIVPKNGESYTVNQLHKLVLVCSGHKDIAPKGEIIEITVDDFLKKPRWWREKWLVFRTSVNFPEQKIEADPYLLGLWLGDGANKSETTIDEIEVLQTLKDYCDNNSETLKQKHDFSYRIFSKKDNENSSAFLNFLRDNNILDDKHIPQCFKINSRQNRLELLAGIIDTNGSYDEKENSYEFTQKSEKLTDDIVFLARTLGFLANKRKTIKSSVFNDEISKKTYFLIKILGNIDDIPCRILGKQTKNKPVINMLESKFYLKKLKIDDYYGFTIDGNHRFLLSTCDVVRNTGKSTLIKGLLYSKKHIFPVGIAMSGSEDTNHAFAEIMPTTFVYNDYNEEKIKDFIKRQKMAKEYLPNPWAFMILDDCTDDPKVFNKPLQNALYKKGRHWSCFYILSLQYAMDVKPQIRTNIDGIFILREPIESNREKLYRNYASIIPTYQLFQQMMDELTEDYHAIYIHNATKSNDWRDCVFYWKAPMTPKGWKVGCPEYWDFHNQRYNPDYKEPIIGF